ncbi:MAG: Smr/MutS family protein [Deltaproteobacteria bacterium]|jgi:DNA mismatch repair protein MutS2|nr:Smr/MutS family protein [Deltaproteobacteria bacterium]
MRNQTLQAIDYGQVLDWLSEIAHSEPGAQSALELMPELAPKAVLANWDLIAQIRAALDVSEAPDLHDHLDLSPILSSLGPEGARLNVPEFKAINLEAKTSAAVLRWLTPLAPTSPLLAAFAEKLFSFDELIASLDRTFGPEGEILDGASARLAALRRELSSARSALTFKLNELIRSEEYRPLLMDDLVTTRNDRFVIPVRASATGKNRGLVHDWSNSGATAYLEPLETVEDNNRLALIKKEEKREIDRILTALSSTCRDLTPQLLSAGAALTKLDLALAEAKLARLWRAHPPTFAPGQGFNLIAATHPILERRLSGLGRHMVPLNIELGPKKPLAVISGVNAGGKTVALKTLGLCVALAKSGLIPPVGEGSYLDFPDELITVMGDGQDLESDLSTFSGHVKALGQALDIAGPGVLVLVDELGSGTDPAEGAALGLAALERLLASGALVLAATHFHLIKSWAALTPGVVSISVNTATMGQPAFGLSYGGPGFSGGLVMARRLGLPADLMDRAEGLLDEGQRGAMELLRKLDEERSALAAQKELLAQRVRETEKLQSEYGAMMAKKVLEHNKRAKELDQKIKEALAQNRLERENLKNEIRAALTGGQKVDPVSANLALAKMDKALSQARPEYLEDRPNVPLRRAAVGSEVLVAPFGKKGLVTAANADRDEYSVNLDGLTVKVGLAQLSEPQRGQKADRKEKRKEKLVGFYSVDLGPSEVALSINLIGKTVAEAEALLSKEIDQAVLRGQSHLTVIHGLGTGRLRRGISDYLKKHPLVSAFHTPNDTPGGAGLTEVDLSGN